MLATRALEGAGRKFHLSFCRKESNYIIKISTNKLLRNVEKSLGRASGGNDSVPLRYAADRTANTQSNGMEVQKKPLRKILEWSAHWYSLVH